MCRLLPHDGRIVVAAPFRIRGIERLLPAGAYEVITDEETIEGLTFSAFRRIATMIMVPAEDVRDSMEMLSIGPPMTDQPVDLDKHGGAEGD